MTEEQKTQDIETIDNQLSSLKEQVDKANLDSAALVEKRDRLNEQFKSLRQEIQPLQIERDKLNQSVVTLKQQRGEAQDKIRAIIEHIKLHRQKIIELREETPRDNYRELKEELESIEWKIQTTTMDLQEEKLLIGRVKELETSLVVFKKIEKQHQNIDKLEAELKGFEAKRNAVHQELTGFALKSQEIHAKMLAKIKESKDARSEADGLHAAYIQAREKSRLLRDQMRQLVGQRRQLMEQKKVFWDQKRASETLLRDEDEKQKKAKEQELKEKLGSQAKDKLQRGEKLNWQEFQLLAGDDPEAESEK